MNKWICTACLAMLLLLAGCSGRTAITAEQFSKTMEDKGYQVVDISSQYDQEEVNSVLVALKDDYQIEFFAFPGVDKATASYKYNEGLIENYKGNGSSYKSASVSNYSYYALTTKEGYYVVSRVDNTFVYATVAPEYKEEASGVIKELGY